MHETARTYLKSSVRHNDTDDEEDMQHLRNTQLSTTLSNVTEEDAFEDWDGEGVNNRTAAKSAPHTTTASTLSSKTNSKRRRAVAINEEEEEEEDIPGSTINNVKTLTKAKRNSKSNSNTNVEDENDAENPPSRSTTTITTTTTTTTPVAKRGNTVVHDIADTESEDDETSNRRLTRQGGEKKFTIHKGAKVSAKKNF